MMVSIHVKRRIRAAIRLTLCAALITCASAALSPDRSASHVDAASAGTTWMPVRPAHLPAPDEENARMPLSDDARTRLMRHEMTILFDVQHDDAPVPAGYRLRMREYPGWIAFNPDSASFELDAHAIRLFLHDHAGAMLQPVRHAVAGDAGKHDAYRLDVTGNPHAGYRLDPAATGLIADALEREQTMVTVPVTYESPTLFLRTASGTMQLERLSRGISDFGGSPYGRSANVVKALESQLNGIVVQPGALFSFTDAMADGAGWSDAYVIAKGGELVLEPGGGICQAATTIFRAAVLAGLPIEERANHSLYVSYYRAHGVGIDATYYPGKQDFSFRNDTGAPVVIVAYAEGETAVVELYGVPDGRTVELNGPYFAEKQEEEARARGFDLKINQIGWLYDVSYPDGSVVQDAIISSYRAIPKKLPDEYTVHPGIKELLGKTGTGGTAL